MTAPKPRNSQFDLFIPLMRDLPLKDQRETMERPFFSLQKRKRLKPIEYLSPDGEVRVKVEAVPAYGMATIWDGDILIWAASALNRLKAEGRNDLPRELKTTAYDLLRSIQRDTGGKGYVELKAALDRLATTTIFTSIRAKRGRDSRFSWLRLVAGRGRSHHRKADRPEDHPLRLGLSGRDQREVGADDAPGLLPAFGRSRTRPLPDRSQARR